MTNDLIIGLLAGGAAGFVLCILWTCSILNGHKIDDDARKNDKVFGSIADNR